MALGRSMLIASCVIAAATVVAAVCAPPSFAGRSDFVGADVCGGCHVEAYKAWKSSAHARADESVGTGVKDSRSCMGCHSTGEAPAGRPFFSGVQCEACHGPGAGYAADDVMRDATLSRNLGLRDLSTPEARKALCTSCHRASTRLAPFKSDKAYKTIEHK